MKTKTVVLKLDKESRYFLACFFAGRLASQKDTTKIKHVEQNCDKLYKSLPANLKKMFRENRDIFRQHPDKMRTVTLEMVDKLENTYTELRKLINAQQ